MNKMEREKIKDKGIRTGFLVVLVIGILSFAYFGYVNFHNNDVPKIKAQTCNDTPKPSPCVPEEVDSNIFNSDVRNDTNVIK